MARRVLWLLLVGLGTPDALAFPVITAFTPNAGAPGTSVIIDGSDLSTTREVRFGTALSIFTVVSSTRVIATVPLDATTGPLGLATGTGSTTTLNFFYVAPRLFDFTPHRGPPGSAVLISGANFEGALAVQFNGTNTAFSVTGPTQIQAYVPTGATSGPVRVITPVGQAVSTTNFVVTGNEPFITRFDPTFGGPGTIVTLTGGNFNGVTAVSFNGTNAPSFSVVAATQMRVQVPNRASSGPIRVTNPLGTGTSADAFQVSTAPVITDFNPIGGPAGTTVTINGANFKGATAVRFAGVSAPVFSVTADTQLNARVPAGATNGPISITTPLGTGSSTDDFLAGAGPIVTGFDPGTGPPGSPVTIDGLNFDGVTSVRFGTLPAQFGVTAPTQIRAVVPPNATNAPITVISPAGTNTTPVLFLVRTGKPMILDFTPNAGVPRTTVTIDGLDFSGATAVTFNGVPAPFSVLADSQITALVPDTASTGPISVTTPLGTSTSSQLFTVAPRIGSFSPLAGVAGTVVTVFGTNLTQVTDVQFDGTAASFTSISSNSLSAIVPEDATTGSISITTPGGIVASTNFFLVLPNITSFTPQSGPVGTQVTIQGTGFSDVTAIRVGGVLVTTATIVSPTQIVATIPSRAVTGPLQVVTSSGSATSADSFFVGLAADLAVTQSIGTNAVLAGQVVNYTLILTNQGPVSATQVVLSDTLPTNSVLLASSTSAGSLSHAGQTVRLSLPTLGNGAFAKVALSVLLAQAGSVSNVVNVSGLPADPDLTDNTSVLNTTVLSSPAILAVGETGNGQLQVSWPANATNFVLQSTTALVPNTTWRNVLTTPIVQGGRATVSLPAAAPVQVFRLRRAAGTTP